MSMRIVQSYIEGTGANVHSFLIRSYMEGSGQIHTPVAHDRRRALCIHGIGGWMGLRTGMNSAENICMSPFSGIEPRIF
jgi:hypothetical protein